jgi:hypothetical protein
MDMRFQQLSSPAGVMSRIPLAALDYHRNRDRKVGRGMNLAEFDKIVGGHISDTVKETDSRYEAERKLLLKELSEEGFMDAVAIHEAGHAHYYTEAGGSEFQFFPPIILFRRDNTRKPFKKQTACIKVGKFSPNQADPIWLLKVAKGYAAGGECSIRLPALCRYRGDTTDRPLWDEACRAAYRESSLPTTQINALAESMWKDAQKKVRAELIASDALQAQIINRAKEIKVQLFPWTASR